MDFNADVTTQDIFNMLAGKLLPSDIHARRAAKRKLKEFGHTQNKIEAEYETLPTTVLIQRLRAKTRMLERAVSGSKSYSGKSEENPTKDWPFDPVYWALKKVLSRRPHVPNKVEGYEARRAAATAHHGPKKGGGRSKLHHPHKHARA